ncbi:MAG TPA: CHAT domain-containing protein [Thioploca sp.]|nr:CHAT domain-containing protein [Thioploca sp.]
MKNCPILTTKRVFALKVLEDDRLFKLEQQNARTLLQKPNLANPSKMFPTQVSKHGESQTCQYHQPQTQMGPLSKEIQQFAQDLLKEKGLAKPDRQRAISQAYFAFQKAAQVAKRLQDNRTRSLAYGYLGQLYEQEQRYDEAMRLTRQAIFFANHSHVSHSNQDQVSLMSPVSHTLYRWYWQLGRILKTQGHLEQAIAAYRLASQNLKPIQNVLDLGYRIPQGLFEQVIRPVHYGLADLLLQKAETIHDEQTQQRLIKEAINGVELVKVSELQDYFDECLLALQSKNASILDHPKLQQELQQTAILYPIPLENRLVVIVSVKGKIHMKSIPVTADKVNYTAWDLRLKLQTRPHNRFLLPARQLYNWLICPIETLLTDNQVDTLVVVPDGKLRMIPFSTLHSGKHFLIEKYAMGLTPGLTLVDPQRIPWDNDNKILLVGLSDAVQNYPALPNVKKEVQKIQDIAKNRALSNIVFNKEFSINNFRNQLKGNEYSIIHLATHGEFDADPEHTYILTYTEKMKMDKLQEVIGLGRFRDKPLKLLTLSACKTAVGDDKAALGLAGIAVKAGARSAIATLWFVDDEATSVAMTDFYQQLLTRGISKAKALQEAQKKLIKIRRYWHPSYWGPFLLIGNWL